MNLTNTVVDLSGAIPATGDLTQWANAGAINDTITIFCDGSSWLCNGSTKATVDAS